MTSRRIALAVGELAGRDPVLATLAETHGPARLGRTVPVAQRFATLVRAIVFQQLAGRAAGTIHGRLVDALGGDVSPEGILALAPDVLGGCGLSGAKAAAVNDLARKVAGGEVGLGRIGRLADEEVVAHLVQVRGIGVWTAQMFLITSLGRIDVWPIGDFGVRAGYGAAWGLGAPPSPAELADLGERFRPYRTVAAWYCWRAADSLRANRTAPGG